ncbi:type VI secretion system ATPase TssH, partial [Crocinitomicaceae bacterium]|nr:type VI secretion system ATPase TssH [Crocinitomicaceae bacterium]
LDVLELLKQTVRPEFLNRIDETILFLPLTKADVTEIVKIQLSLMREKLAVQNINLVVKEDAFNWIAEMGYDPFFGARPIKRVIQKNVMNELSKALLSDQIDRSKNVIMDVFDDQIVFRKPINEEWKIVVE